MVTTHTTNDETKYVYYFADGKQQTITAGEDGVEQEDIIRLYEMDEQEKERIDKENDAKSRTFQCQMAEYMNDRSGTVHDPVEELTYPEKSQYHSQKSAESYPTIKELREIIKLLDKNQRLLLQKLYFLEKNMSEVAREENVSPQAIRNRRNRIFEKIRKIYQAMKGGDQQ